jgi:hypothetical protein
MTCVWLCEGRLGQNAFVALQGEAGVGVLPECVVALQGEAGIVVQVGCEGWKSLVH